MHSTAVKGVLVTICPVNMDIRGRTRYHITLTAFCIVVTVINILINGGFLLNYRGIVTRRVAAKGGEIRRIALNNEASIVEDDIQMFRLRQLNEACERSRDLYIELTTHRAIHTELGTITKTHGDLGINYCKVPKVGCTFMLQMFNIITNHMMNASEVFAMSRYSVHKMDLKPVKHNRHIFYSIPTILMARNPYSRLYSAYVDKIILPSKLDSITMCDNSTLASCKDRPSFQQFLEYIIEGVRTNQTINSHWAPIYGMCKPCETDNIMIIKQESFADDIAVLLDYLGVSNKTRETITQALVKGRASASVPGIIITTMSRANGRRHKKYLTMVDSVMLLWRSFQIQGFLRPSNRFPVERNMSNMTINTIVEIIMKEIEADAITSDERKVQRKAYLVDAYKDIPTGVIEKIKSIYELDFLLFGYDMTPPE